MGPTRRGSQSRKELLSPIASQSRSKSNQKKARPPNPTLVCFNFNIRLQTDKVGKSNLPVDKNILRPKIGIRSTRVDDLQGGGRRLDLLYGVVVTSFSRPITIPLPSSMHPLKGCSRNHHVLNVIPNNSTRINAKISGYRSLQRLSGTSGETLNVTAYFGCMRKDTTTGIRESEAPMGSIDNIRTPLVTPPYPTQPNPLLLDSEF